MLKRFSIKLTDKNEPYLRVYLDLNTMILKLYHSKQGWIYRGKLDEYNGQFDNILLKEIDSRLPYLNKVI